MIEDLFLAKTRQLSFHFDDDAAALKELNVRLGAAGRRENVITYSELVRGIIFHLPTVFGGAPIELGVPEWSELHRAIIGGCLGRTACDSYAQGQFLVSALAVSKVTGEPSEGLSGSSRRVGITEVKTGPAMHRYLDRPA